MDDPSVSFLKPETENLEIEIFDSFKNSWAKGEDPLIEEKRFLWVYCPETKNLPENYIVLVRAKTPEVMPISFFTHLNHVSNRERLDFPIFLIKPSAASKGSRRQDYRVSTENQERIFVKLWPSSMNEAEPPLESILNDLSAGGLGLIVNEEMLQKIQLDTQFRVEFSLAIEPNNPEKLETIKTQAILRNAHPIQEKMYQFGLQFTDEGQSASDIKRATTCLLHYVAARQREILKNRIQTQTQLEDQEEPES